MKWNEIGTRINKVRSDHSLGLAAFGKLVGKHKSNGKPVSHVTVRNWEAGSEIKKDNWDALILAIKNIDPNKTEEWLKTGKEQNLVEDRKGDYNTQALPALKDKDKVPVISMVQAGDWSEVADPYPMGEGEDRLPCPYPHGDNTFAVKISGQSMSPEFPEGMIIFIDPNEYPENKQYCVAKLDDTNEATFKQFVVEDGQKFLKAVNPDWPNKYLPINGNCHIIGRLIGVYMKY